VFRLDCEDFKKTLGTLPNDAIYFFEVNPSGQFLWLEAELGLPILASLGDLLLMH
jgi:hypothetical protein